MASSIAAGLLTQNLDPVTARLIDQQLSKQQDATARAAALEPTQYGGKYGQLLTATSGAIKSGQQAMFDLAGAVKDRVIEPKKGTLELMAMKREEQAKLIRDQLKTALSSDDPAVVASARDNLLGLNTDASVKAAEGLQARYDKLRGEIKTDAKAAATEAEKAKSRTNAIETINNMDGLSDKQRQELVGNIESTAMLPSEGLATARSLTKPNSISLHTNPETGAVHRIQNGQDLGVLFQGKPNAGDKYTWKDIPKKETTFTNLWTAIQNSGDSKYDEIKSAINDMNTVKGGGWFGMWDSSVDEDVEEFNKIAILDTAYNIRRIDNTMSPLAAMIKAVELVKSDDFSSIFEREGGSDKPEDSMSVTPTSPSVPKGIKLTGSVSG